MNTYTKTSRLYWYISAACRKCRSGSKYQNLIYLCTIPHHIWWIFTTTSARITNNLIQLGQFFKNNRELPLEEFQFRIGNQCKTPTGRSEGDRKVDNNLPSDQIEESNSRYIKTYLSPQREQIRYINRQKITPVLVCLKREIMKMMNIIYR